MALNNLKYCEYFDVNEKYFPCIDESAINAGAEWTNTYPHESFIQLLNYTEKMLGGSTNRSLWIHGAYGTGKSQCALALRRILEVSEKELRDYWDMYESLRKNATLLEKIVGHKEQGILTAYRYASGSISTPHQLFLAVQESIKQAMINQKIPKMGENTLKESVIAWLDKKANNSYVTELLQEPKWMSTFSQSTADEIINALRKSSDVTGLMNNIFAMASEEGITALSITADSLRDWIVDIIHQNNIKIVLIWDEFSDFFRQNKDSLGEFQKVVSICQEVPFYFIIVTHPLSSIAQKLGSANDKDNPWSIVQQRFDKVEITLPDNIAFDLIGHAFSVKAPAKAQWDEMTSDLNGYGSVPEARQAIMKAANITNENVMHNILPIHPVAALVLKNIASAFQSNQRSMFDFIKTPKDLDVHAFQWFIQNTSPLSDRPYLSVDMLWDFFYEKGKDYLTSDIKLILDTFPQQTQLVEREKTVLKTILIMQAIDQRLGGSIPVLKPTDQNLSYAFSGDNTGLDTSCKSIAKALVEKGVLIQTPIADGKKVYAAAVLAGDNARIDNYKKDIREKNGTTVKLVSEAPVLKTSLSLTNALKLRFATNLETGEIPVVTVSDFTRAMDTLKSKDISWRFYSVMALAKTEDEAQTFRALIKKTVTDEAYKNIIVIDALSTPLGLEAFEKYVDFSAMSTYYNGNNNQQSKDNARKAKEVLERDWRDRIHDGQFIVYSYACQEGEKATGASAVHTILQTYVLNKYRHVQDFAQKLTESQLKLTQAKQVSRIGMGDVEVRGLISGCEKTILSKVWNRDAYWEDVELKDNSIVIIKKAVDKIIAAAFNDSGKISIGEIYDYLEDTFGFSQCNLSAFITGFLLKEYSKDPYRYMDDEGHRESMTSDKLSEMIGNYIGKNAKPTYIVSLTDEEKAFYNLTETAWGISENFCTSPQQAGSMILAKMRELAFPVWCLEDVDKQGVFDLVKMYMELVQGKGDNAHGIANDIGKIAMQRSTAGAYLKELLTEENCQRGMEMFLERFEGNKLYNLADDIGARDSVLKDIKKLFSIQYSALWQWSTGEDEIRKLIVEYDVVKQTNMLLNTSARSKEMAFGVWRDVLKFIGYSCEAVKAKYTRLDKFFYNLLKIVNYEDMLPEHMKAFLDEMINHNTEIRDLFSNPTAVFSELYSPYLEGLTEIEREEVKNSITVNMFTLSASQSNITVKKAAEDYKKNQLKTQLFAMWREKASDSKSPRDWSSRFKTPILACIPVEKYEDAKKAFSVLNSTMQSEAEIKTTLSFLENSDFLEKIADETYRDEQFKKIVLGDYATLLPDINKVRDVLEELGIDAYEWKDSPAVRSKLFSMARAEYNAGGSDHVVSEIKNMKPEELQSWLTEVVKNDMDLGVKILINRRK